MAGHLLLNQALMAYFGTTHLDCSHLGKGNINKTLLVRNGSELSVLQRLNPAVFPDPQLVVRNFHHVTSHLDRKARSEGISFSVPRLIPTRSGEEYYVDGEGGCWRAQTYIEHVPLGSGGEEYGSQLGRVLARFHFLVEDIVPNRLAEVIPGFHDLDGYLERYDQLIDGGVYGAVQGEGTDACRAFIAGYREKAGVLGQERDRGFFTARVIHGDPKLDNVIFTKDGRAAGLFDLDTVGSGLLHYDLGDCLRSFCNRAGESGDDRQVGFDPELFRAVLLGYKEGAPIGLNGDERQYIVDGVFTVAFELGLRFLTDHLEGDVYFRVEKRGDNLVRSRVQFALARSILTQEDLLRRTVEGVFTL